MQPYDYIACLIANYLCSFNSKIENHTIDTSETSMDKPEALDMGWFGMFVWDPYIDAKRKHLFSVH